MQADALQRTYDYETIHKPTSRAFPGGQDYRE